MAGVIGIVEELALRTAGGKFNGVKSAGDGLT